MTNCQKIFFALLLALLFIMPPVDMLQFDSSDDGMESRDQDGSVLTNEQDSDDISGEESGLEEQEYVPEEVNVDGDKSSKKYLDAFKLNFDPWNPEDGETVECTATVHNFGEEWQVAEDVNVEFWFNEDFIGTANIEEIQPGDNGTATVEWKAVYGSHMMKVVADPDASGGGPDDYEVQLNVSRSDYSLGLSCAENASWIKNSQTNIYYILVENRGDQFDTYDLTLETTKYGEDTSGWQNIQLDDDVVALDTGETAYVELSIKYLAATPDYKTQAVVKVIAQSRGDSERSAEVYTTTDMIHDVPILFVDDDGQHDEDGDGNPQLPGTFWLDWDGTYGAHCDYLMEAALEQSYEGMYDYVQLTGDVKGGGWQNDNNMGDSGPVFNSDTTGYNIATYPYEDDNGDDIFLENYDAVIWVMGYCECLNADPSGSDDPGSNNDDWYDQEEVAKYLDNGGMFWFNGNSINQYHDQYAPVYGECQNEFINEYFGVYNWAHAGMKPQIVGVSQDPIGKGINVQNGYFYGNYVDSVERGNVAPDIQPTDDAHGVFYGNGKYYSAIRYEHERESANSQRYRTFISGGFENFGDFEVLYEPQRIQLVENVLTWFGVPPANAPEYDLGVASINQPLGEIIDPAHAVPISVTIQNYGQKEITSSFDVRFRVDEVGGGNKFSKTVSVTDDLAPGESIEVATSWNSNLPQDGEDYTFTISLPSPPGGTGENSDNNELETEKSAIDTVDIEIGRITQDWETPWNAFMVGFDAVFHSKIINNGSSEQTFDVHLTIYSPLETIVFERTQTLTLLPGYTETLDWLWEPRNPGGIMTGYGGGPNDLQEAYIFHIYAEVEDDDNLANNEGEVDVAVMAWWDGGEPAFMKEDWVQVDLSGHDNHGNEDEITPWHLQDSWFMSPNHAWFIANDDRELKAGWDTAIITPYQISFEGVTRASCISTGSGNAGGASARYEISADYDGNPDNMEDATWNQIRSATYGNEGVWVVGGATSISDSYFGEDYYLRLHFGTTNSNARLGHYEEDFAIFANVNQYNSNDLGVKKMSISPLIDQAEMPRDIEVTVENYGENKTNNGGRPNFKVEVSIMDDDLEIYNEKIIVDDVLGIGETVTVKFQESNGREWYPEQNGIYQISARTIWEVDGETIDENPHNDILVIDGIVQKDFFTDDMEDGTNDWTTAGGANGWALGMPTNEPIPHSGDNCWGTNLEGNYPDLNDNSITLEHYVDLRTASDPVLSFWHWLEVEAHDYDTAFVEIRTSQEETYTQIWENPTPNRRGVPFETEEWQVVTLEIDDFAYHEVFIRFRLETDGDTNYLGWYVDDVAVGGTIPPHHDARIVSIDYPADDTHIPPGETIEVTATVMNVGQNQEVINVVAKAYRQGGSPKTFDVGDEDTELLNPGDKEQVTFTWNLPLGTNEYELHIYTNLGTDENDENDLLTKYVWAQEIFDISIETVYADPMVQDVARTREITAEVRNIGNTQLDGNIEVTFEAYLVDYDDDPVDSHTAVLTLGRGESSPVPWNWQSFKYGEYYVVVTGEIVGKTEKPEHLFDNSYTLTDIITVETIFSDTREMDDSPYYLDRDLGEFRIWDHSTQNFFWSQDDNMSQDNMPGWHVEDEGHFSRYSWYGGMPSQGRYANNMESYLTSQALDLTGYNDVHLSFYTKYVLEGRLYDFVDISITNDIGDENSWERLVKYPGDDDSYDSSRQAGNNYGWLHKDILIPETYLTGEVYLRILLKTDNGITYSGVWIDDITLFGQTSGNHAPVARFGATYKDSSYSRNVILNPPMDLIHIKGNFAYNNMPLPNGTKQGGVPVGSSITFDASLTFDPDPDDDYISYNWDFGDDETDSGKVVAHEFDGEVPLEGYFIVTLTVMDGDGKEAIDTIFVHVGNTAPVPDYHVTPYYNVHYYIDEHNDPIPEDDIIDVFYGDRIRFVQNASDAEGDTLEYEWFFECLKTGHIDTDEGDTVEGIVGIDFLIEDLDDGVPTVPTPNTNAVDYEVSIEVSDPATTTIMTKTVRVHPYARETFTKSVRLGNTLSEAEATVTWRGFQTEAAEAGLVSPEHPVFVYIDETAISPDPLLVSRGGIGHVYDITCVGTYLQNGEERFIHAEVKLPILTSDLSGIGDSQALEKDLKLEYYDENQKRFFPVDDSQVYKDKGISYVSGSAEHFSLFTAIVDTVYIGQLSADLSVEEMVFSRAPVIDRSETEIRVRIRNIGPINAKDVKVRFFDGSELIDERTIPEIKANDPDGVWVKVSYNVSMVNTDGLSEKHTVVVNVNPLHAVKEEQYNNNIEQEQLDVVRQATSTNSFGMSFIMLAISAMAVVALAEVYKRKR